MNRKLYIAVIVFSYVGVVSTYAIVFLGPEKVVALCAEDGFVENMGSLFFLIAGLLFLAAYRGSTIADNRFFWPQG